MWITVLVLGLMAATEPGRLGIALLLISLPRPLHNLLAYWLGGVAVNTASALGALMLLRNSVPMVMQDVTSTVTSYAGGYLQTAIGVLALLLAALILVGIPTRKNEGAYDYGEVLPAPILQSTAFSRLTCRVHHALKDGYPRIAFATGVVSAIVSIEYAVVLTTILSSRAAIGTQFGAVVMFNLVMFALVEISLVSYLAMPTKTEARILLLQKWLRAHGRQIVAVIVAAIGVVLVATGISGT